jgi:hypothetical protein
VVVKDIAFHGYAAADFDAEGAAMKAERSAASEAAESCLTRIAI